MQIYITSLAKKTAKRLYILSRSRDLLPFTAKITIYKAYIRPLMEYASPIWSGAGSTALGLLSRLQRKALRILGIHDPIKAGIYPLEHRKDVATLCTFYRHFFFKPSIELGAILPPLLSYTRTTRSSSASHLYCVTIPIDLVLIYINHHTYQEFPGCGMLFQFISFLQFQTWILSRKMFIVICSLNYNDYVKGRSYVLFQSIYL